MTAKGKTGRAAVAAPAEQARSIELARRILAMRRLRDRLLGSFFSEPSWDILLELYVQTHEGKTVTVSQLSLSTGAPPTTALRWIKRLTDEGIFVRTADPRDGRRVFIDLSERAAEAIAAYVRAIEGLAIASP